MIHKKDRLIRPYPFNYISDINKPKTMKKIISIAVLALIVAACGGSKTTEANDSTSVVVDTVTAPADTLATGGSGAGTVPTEHKK